MTKPPRFSPFPRVSSKYGAPMGRYGGTLAPGIPFDNLCTSKPQGEYDCGGAYWGLGGRDGPVFAVWERGKGKQGVIYVRARGPLEAKRKALDYDTLYCN